MALKPSALKLTTKTNKTHHPLIVGKEKAFHLVSGIWKISYKFVNFSLLFSQGIIFEADTLALNP